MAYCFQIRSKVFAVGILCFVSGFREQSANASECEQKNYGNAFDFSSNVINVWQSESHVGVSDEMRIDIASSLCVGVQKISTMIGSSYDDQLKQSADGIREYLDQNLKSSNVVPSLLSLLISKYSLNSEDSSPDVKVYGQLSVVYNDKFNKIKVGDRVMDTYTTFLVPIGRRTVAGLLGEVEACKKDIQITPASTITFTC